MKHPANANKVYPSRKIALLRILIPACLFLLYQLLIAAISYCIFRYLFEWNYAMEVVNCHVDFDQGDFFFTVKRFQHIAFWSLTAVALALFCLNMKRHLWNQVIFLCFAIALYLTLGTILFRHELALVKAGGTWNVSADVPGEVRLENIRRNAEKGDVYAMRTLGTHYERGWDVRRDATAAVKWYARAAAKGDEEALSRLEELAGEGNAGAQKALESLSRQEKTGAESNPQGSSVRPGP